MLDGELARKPFIAGNQYTIADISLFAYNHVAADAGFDVTARKNLGARFDRVRAQRGFDGEVISCASDPDCGGKLPFAV